MKNYFKRVKFIKSEWISALSNLGILILAIYGIWWTNIPETLINSLNQEVSELRTEKIFLTNEIKGINEENQTIKSDYNQIKKDKQEIEESLKSLALEREIISAEKEKLVNEIKIISIEKEKYFKDISQISQELSNQKNMRKEYIESIKTIIIDGIISKLEMQYEKGIQYCREGIHLKEFEDWINGEKEKDREIKKLKEERDKIRNSLFVDNTDKYIELDMKIASLIHDTDYPETFSEEILYSILSGYFRDTNDESMKFVNEEELFNYKKTIFSKLEKLSGYDAVNNLNEVNQFNLLTNQDRLDLFHFLVAYARERSHIYSKIIHPTIPDGWTFEDLKLHSGSILNNINILNEDTINLRVELNKFFQKKIDEL